MLLLTGFLPDKEREDFYRQSVNIQSESRKQKSKIIAFWNRDARLTT